ncbi:MAG: hypothetical protein ACYDBT_07170, partial [Desulfobulbaceae bacterium]
TACNACIPVSSGKVSRKNRAGSSKTRARFRRKSSRLSDTKSARGSYSLQLHNSSIRRYYFATECSMPLNSFRKNHYRISRHVNRFGKNIIITDNMDWSTDEIVRASLDRYVVEEAFRQTKDDDLVAMMPPRHICRRGQSLRAGHRPFKARPSENVSHCPRKILMVASLLRYGQYLANPEKSLETTRAKCPATCQRSIRLHIGRNKNSWFS